MKSFKDTKMDRAEIFLTQVPIPLGLTDDTKKDVVPYPFYKQFVFSIKTPYENIDEKELDESNLRMIPFGLSEKIAEKKKLRDELAKMMINHLKEIRNELSKKLNNLSQEEKEKVNKMKKDKMKTLIHLDEMIF